MFNWFKKKTEYEKETTESSVEIEQYNPYNDGGVRLKQLLTASKFIYRDTTLSESLQNKYRVGLFFKEPTACDASAKFGGINGNVRFLIVTSSPKDLSILSPNPEFGHSVIGLGEIYKVIAVSKNNGYTQITLLHIPPEFKSYFESTDAKDFESIVLQSAEKDFQEACSAPIDPHLSNQDWVERVKHPIGLNQNNEAITA